VSHAWTDFLPLPSPRRADFATTTAPHRVFFEEYGRADGPPVVVVHGGPGSGTGDPLRRLVDPARFRIVTFDQRGCGRSEPWGRFEDLSLSALVDDMEALRRHLAIERWTIVAGSWGSTLALSYAQAHPERAIRLVLWGTWLFRPADVHWWLVGARQVFPEPWRRFADHVDGHDGSDAHGLLAAYRARLFDPRSSVHGPAAVAWKSYERRLRRFAGWNEEVDLAESDALVNACRVMAHLFTHDGLDDRAALQAGAGRLATVPATLVHGRYDMVCPFDNAYDLCQAWPRAKLVEILQGGHALEEPAILGAVLQAINGDP
jgi:proline iminopeptidase